MRWLIALLFTTAIFAQQRIVSTSPSITETLFALGLGSQVVAVSTYCHFPAAVDRLPKVGTYLKPNVEVIARLKPSLVFVETLPNSVRGQLAALKLSTVEIETGSLTQNLDAILVIGKAAGAERQARALIERIQGGFADLRAQNVNRQPRSAAFIVGRTPGKLEGLIAVGGGSYLSELLAIAGARNVFADAPQGYVKVNLESVLRRNPDVVIDMGEMAETVGITEAAKQAVVRLWGTRPGLTAVRERHVFAIASDIFVVPGPRMLDAARAFSDMLRQGRTQ
jgi:iron complex transport system substrate-binding protein